MKNLVLKNGREVSLKVEGTRIRTGEVSLGYVFLNEPNVYNKKYGVHLLLDKNDEEFKKAISIAMKNAFELAKRKNEIPKEDQIKDYIFPVKNYGTKTNVSKNLMGKDYLDLKSKIPVKIYDENVKPLSPRSVRVGDKVSVIFTLQAFKTHLRQGFALYINYIMPQKDSSQLMFFFDDVDAPDTSGAYVYDYNQTQQSLQVSQQQLQQAQQNVQSQYQPYTQPVYQIGQQSVPQSAQQVVQQPMQEMPQYQQQTQPAQQQFQKVQQSNYQQNTAQGNPGKQNFGYPQGEKHFFA